jgi:hypothetical protein
MAARHFLDQLGAGPVLSKDSNTDEARVLVVQVQERLQPAQGRAHPRVARPAALPQLSQPRRSGRLQCIQGVRGRANREQALV